MANINVTYEEMDNAASYLVTNKEEVQTTLSALRDYIENLVNSGFVTDQASTAFNQTYQDFTTNATEVIENLTNLGNYLTSAAEQMRATDEALAAQARG
ncbi:WXG100 family type VII secretion target [Georgenia satyanarayanai]|uniref:ESAT-6-like protein n=1 Tax=Oceanitalea stevensii TaxID=2763072 RepID=A0ABR8Z521_9MICO|nr:MULTISPECIES: WXG100 family type VII secretion target [Georgenia]MBD8062894.1 WXG100 family type VII secretion target [Oceanitalea stevensii]MCM3659611.1 WXG100 family type VII secretion target [Georgenia satyanarayanai]